MESYSDDDEGENNGDVDWGGHDDDDSAQSHDDQEEEHDDDEFSTSDEHIQEHIRDALETLRSKLGQHPLEEYQREEEEISHFVDQLISLLHTLEEKFNDKKHVLAGDELMGATEVAELVESVEAVEAAEAVGAVALL